MKTLSFYEQVGIVIPGAAFLFGLIFYVPQLKDVLSKGGISVGALGVFVLVAYAAGHLVAAFGNLLETPFWWIQGGVPSDWVLETTGKLRSTLHPTLLSDKQRDDLKPHVAARLGKSLDWAVLKRKDWFPTFREIYSDVQKHGKVERADAFNGNYGLNRGLGAGLLALCLVSMAHAPHDPKVSWVLLLTSLLFFYRMRRFGVHYARDVYLQFLLLPATPANAPTPKKPRKVRKPEDLTNDNEAANPSPGEAG